jgi:Arc/MetJ-type ribon-helix-helix transcriptional regulator
MSTSDIHLPQQLRRYLAQQAARRGYKDPSALVRALVEADRDRLLDDELEKMLLEAADGPFEEWTDEDVAQIRRVGIKLIERRRRRKSA